MQIVIVNGSARVNGAAGKILRTVTRVLPKGGEGAILSDKE